MECHTRVWIVRTRAFGSLGIVLENRASFWAMIKQKTNNNRTIQVDVSIVPQGPRWQRPSTWWVRSIVQGEINQSFGRPSWSRPNSKCRVSRRERGICTLENVPRWYLYFNTNKRKLVHFDSQEIFIHPTFNERSGNSWGCICPFLPYKSHLAYMQSYTFDPCPGTPLSGDNWLFVTPPFWGHKSVLKF